MIEAFPLAWPVGWPRQKYPASATFRTSLADARDNLNRELWLLGATGVVISSNAVLNKDGQISARQRVIADPGVAVYFVLDGQQNCIPCDKWDRIEDNVQAIRLTVAALRGLERWGAKEVVSAAFQGFAALPAGGEDGWWSVLGVAPTASEVEVEAAYRAKRRAAHPDAGGDAEQFLRVQRAYEQAKSRQTA